MSLPTLTDVAVFNRDVLFGLVDQATKVTPEINAVGWRTVPGTFYQTLKLTTDPVVAFRDVNTGAVAVHSTYANATISCKLLNPRWECDKAVAEASIWGAEAFIALEAQRLMQATMLTLAKQFYYGTSADAGGFPGLQGQVDSSMVVDATGTTATTGSSVYIVAAENPDDLAWVLGGNGALNISDVRLSDITDGSSNRYTAYIQDATIWTGLQLGHKYAVARIKNLTEDANKGLTDTLLYQALEKFPAILKPSAIFMTGRSLRQLRNSRTSYNPLGQPSPIPAGVEGFGGANIPIYRTEALSNVEAIA